MGQIVFTCGAGKLLRMNVDRQSATEKNPRYIRVPPPASSVRWRTGAESSFLGARR